MKVESVVHQILLINEYSRGDDFYLYGKVLEFMFPNIEYVGVIDFFLNNHDGAPAMESVTRARRKLQSKYEELKPNEKIQNIRKMNEIEMKKYALN